MSALTEQSESAEPAVDPVGLSAAFAEWNYAAGTVSSAELEGEDGCRDVAVVGERDGAEAGTAPGGIGVVGSGFESREEADLGNSLVMDHALDQVLSLPNDDTATVLEVRCQEIEGPQTNQDD